MSSKSLMLLRQDWQRSCSEATELIDRLCTHIAEIEEMQRTSRAALDVALEAINPALPCTRCVD